ncbi:bifunctional UDP-N-acetylmuramoyl-tripeptide:D-alanyl-D-alanine ligase/alanine racemase [Cyclobacterium plantarum]|uniref:bifunctional UDP-N-acetylmuramoyl-tripeptide:D-alanyl-D-alanine ligase/alanine racemase n=1 Tax=Cyclobacterium plantarum TaxID=2716263 RepID=UPI003F6F0174
MSNYCDKFTRATKIIRVKMIQPINIKKFAGNYGGKFLGLSGSDQISQVTIDSRKIQSGEETLFVALDGSRQKGSDFAEDAHGRNVRNFILPLAGEKNTDKLEDSNILLVEKPLNALQALAVMNREAFKGPVVGITGSNGKTIVKEWLAQVLSQGFQVFKSPKSYNSQIGVALSALEIQSRHQIALLEAGISQPGEMDRLKQIIQPQLGIFTNIGSAHDENFDSLETKIKEKCKLFTEVKYLIYRKDHSRINHLLKNGFDPDRLISWSDKTGADYTLSVRPEKNGSKIFMVARDLQTYTFFTTFRDSASLENIRHVIVSCMTLGMKPENIQKGLQLLHAVDMRLTLKSGINRCLLIDDSYNNDLAGLEIALEFMAHQRKPTGRKILILSEMLQEGDEIAVFQKIAGLSEHYEIDLFAGVGKHFSHYKHLFPKQSVFFPDTASLLENILGFNLDKDLILVKGARDFHFEKIIQFLEAQVHETVLEINLNALRHNFNFYKRILRPETKIMVMVKAFAYGGGSAEIANHLQKIGADYLSVAYIDEGVYLRQKGVTLPIMVMNPDMQHLNLIQDYDLEPVVYNRRTLQDLTSSPIGQPNGISIHLELDTGMSRLGFTEADLEDILTLLGNHKEIKLAGLFTHLAGADEAIHEDFSRKQLRTFDRISKVIMSTLACSPIRHALNSAGIIRFPDQAFDMVRLGIGLHGVEINQLEQEKLLPVATLKTVVSQIKKLTKAETIGYGRQGKLIQDGKIATLAIGYADGYDRRFGNGKAFVMIQGKRANTIGNICMDMCMVDVSGLQVREGDEVILFGKEPSLQYLAAQIGTIPYELLTGIGMRVKRQYILD